jgi:hypothetical protein
MPKLISRFFESRAYKVLSHLSTVSFGVGIAAAIIAAIASWMHNKPIELILLYTSVIGACAMVIVNYAVQAYNKLWPAKSILPVDEIDLAAQDRQNRDSAKNKETDRPLKFERCTVSKESHSELETIGVIPSDCKLATADFYNDPGARHFSPIKIGYVKMIYYDSKDKAYLGMEWPLWITNETAPTMELSGRNRIVLAVLDCDKGEVFAIACPWNDEASKTPLQKGIGKVSVEICYDTHVGSYSEEFKFSLHVSRKLKLSLLAKKADSANS